MKLCIGIGGRLLIIELMLSKIKLSIIFRTQNDLELLVIYDIGPLTVLLMVHERKETITPLNLSWETSRNKLQSCELFVLEISNECYLLDLNIVVPPRISPNELKTYSD